MSTTEDRRVTRAAEWGAGILATLIVGALVWIGNTLTQIKEQQAVFINDMGYVKNVNAAQDARLDIYDGRLRAVERSIR